MANEIAGGRVVESAGLTVATPTPDFALVDSTSGAVITTTNPSDGGAQGLQLLDTGVNGEDGDFTGTSAQKSADAVEQSCWLLVIAICF